MCGRQLRLVLCPPCFLDTPGVSLGKKPFAAWLSLSFGVPWCEGARQVVLKALHLKKTAVQEAENEQQTFF
jgi:hypothetical protein